MNTRIICALFKKDLKGCLSNKNILVSFLIPIVFCFIYQYMFSGLGDDVNTYVLSMCAVFSISIIPSSILPVMIAEEKEKYTLRSLMLARVQGQEFLASKMLICLLMVLIDAAAVFFISGGNTEGFPVYIGAALIGAASLCFLGALAGLTAKDQSSAGTLSAPLMLITMLPPFFYELNETVAKLAVIVPTTSFQTLYRAAVAGRGIFTGKCFTALCVCAVWIIGGYILFNIFYRRKGIDC